MYFISIAFVLRMYYVCIRSVLRISDAIIFLSSSKLLERIKIYLRKIKKIWESLPSNNRLFHENLRRLEKQVFIWFVIFRNPVGQQLFHSQILPHVISFFEFPLQTQLDFFTCNPNVIFRIHPQLYCPIRNKDIFIRVSFSIHSYFFVTLSQYYRVFSHTIVQILLAFTASN